MIRSGDGRPFAAVQAVDLARLPAEVVALARRAHATSQVVPARNYRLTANTTSFEVQATGPGVIALHETLSPQRFSGDSERPTDGLFPREPRLQRHLRPGGGHLRVTFAYWPSDFSLSLGWPVSAWRVSSPAGSSRGVGGPPRETGIAVLGGFV